MWQVVLNFRGERVVLPGLWKTQDEAEWIIAAYKQTWNITGDPFVYEFIPESNGHL